MRSEKDYNYLVRYRQGDISASETDFPDIHHYLVDRKYIAPVDLGYQQMGNLHIIGRAGAYRLTDTGEAALLKFEQERDKRTKEERQQRFDNKISVAGVLVPLITFFLGMMIEHFGGFIGILLGLIQ